MPLLTLEGIIAVAVVGAVVIVIFVVLFCLCLCKCVQHVSAPSASFIMHCCVLLSLSTFFFCVDVSVDAGCCSIHYQNLKRREAIQHIAGNPNYDADLERLRVLKFSRDDYRSVIVLLLSIHLHNSTVLLCMLARTSVAGAPL